MTPDVSESHNTVGGPLLIGRPFIRAASVLIGAGLKVANDYPTAIDLQKVFNRNRGGTHLRDSHFYRNRGRK